MVAFSTPRKQFELVVRQNHGRPQGGGQNAQLESWTKNQNFLDNMTAAAQFRLIDLCIAMTVY